MTILAACISIKDAATKRRIVFVEILVISALSVEDLKV